MHGDLLDTAFERSLTASKEDPELASLDLIGWYGMRSFSETGLLDEEIEFQNRKFRRISDIALIVSLTSEGQSLNFYSRWPNAAMSRDRHRSASVQLRDGTLITESMEVTTRGKVNDDYQRRVYQVLESMHEAQRTGKSITFSPQNSGLATADPAAKGERPTSDRHAPTSYAAASPDHSLESESTHFDESPLFRFGPIARHAAIRSIGTNRKLWITCASFLVIAGVLIFSWPYLRTVPSLIRKHIPVAVAAGHNSAALGMRVQAQGDALLVSWDRQSETMRSADSAVLEISDGSRYREIHLDSNEIANGSLLYRPASSDVALRLKVSGKQGSMSSENVRVLDGSNTPSDLNLSGSQRSRAASSAIAKNHAAGPGARNPASNQVAEAVQSSTPRKSASERLSASPNAQLREIASAVPKLGTREIQPSTPRSMKRVGNPQVPHREKPPASGLAAQLPAKPARAVVPAVKDAPPAKSVATLDSGAPGIVGTRYAPHKIVPRASPVYVPPHPIKQVMPTGVFGQSVIDKPVQIDVQLRIDDTGRVAALHVAKVSEQNEWLVRAAVAAAKEWIFQPATIDGKNVPCDHTIEFRFTPEAR
jgi:hypothetical protein